MEKVNKEIGLFVGFDVGSSFVHYVVLNGDKEITYSPKAIMHFANPIGVIKEAWRDIIKRFPQDKIKSAAFTGSNARLRTHEILGSSLVSHGIDPRSRIPAGVGSGCRDPP